MAYIEGLQESIKALAEIKKILKEVENINQFMSIENPTTMYRLSFSVKNPDYKEELQEEFIPLSEVPGYGMEGHTDTEAFHTEEASVTVNTEATQDPDKKKTKKEKKTIQYSAPLLCDDRETLYAFVQLYKERKVRTVKQLADTNGIYLTEKDRQILGIE